MGPWSQDKRVKSDVVQFTSSSNIGVSEVALGNGLERGWSKNERDGQK